MFVFLEDVVPYVAVDGSWKEVGSGSSYIAISDLNPRLLLNLLLNIAWIW